MNVVILLMVSSVASFSVLTPPKVSSRRSPRHRLSATISEVSLPKPLGLLLEEEDEGSATRVYIKEILGSGSAADCSDVSEGQRIVSAGGVDCSGLGLDDVMDAIASAPSPVVLELASDVCLLRVVDDGKSVFVSAKEGDNLRKVLQGAGCKVYDFKGTLTNCNGGGQCGTCVVQIDDAPDFAERPEWEAKKLNGRPENHRLSCQLLVAGGQATVTLRPPRN